MHLGAGEPPVPISLLPGYAAPYALLGALGGAAFPSASWGAWAAVGGAVLGSRMAHPLGVPMGSSLVAGVLLASVVAVLARRTGSPGAVAAWVASLLLPLVNLYGFPSTLDPAALLADLLVLIVALTAALAVWRLPALRWAPIAPWAIVLVLPALRDRSPPPAPVPDGRPPLLLIVVDTLRADHLGAYGHPGGLTPNLDAFAERAIVYEQAQSAAPWTVPAFGSLFTGRNPSAHGAGLYEGRFTGLSPEVPTLIGDLRERGYATGALVANPWLREFSGLGRDFDRWDADATGHAPLLVHAFDAIGARAMDSPRYLPADAQTDRAIAWMRALGDGPWLLVVHYMDPHSPYAPPREHRIGAPGDDLERWLYEGEVRFLDAELGRLLEAAPAHAWIAVTSDHGEEFGEHARPEGIPPGTRHGHTQFQELLHVPLIVRPPSAEPGRIERTVRSHDLLPTLLVAAGVPLREGLDAEPLAEALGAPPPVDERPAISEQILFGPEQKAVRLGALKLVASGDAEQLFDLGADPAERTDLASSRPEDLARLRARLPDAARPGLAVDPDEATRDLLRGLGYIDGPGTR